MADLIVKAAVKEALDDKNVASDFYDALDEEVSELLDDAAVTRVVLQDQRWRWVTYSFVRPSST